MSKRTAWTRVATGWALAIVMLASARASAGETEARSARPTTVDYVDGTVGVD